VCFSVLDCAGVCCSILECVGVCCSELECVAACRNQLMRMMWSTVCCRVLQCPCIAVCVAVCPTHGGGARVIEFAQYADTRHLVNVSTYQSVLRVGSLSKGHAVALS